jgi:hypothetical protein
MNGTNDPNQFNPHFGQNFGPAGHGPNGELPDPTGYPTPAELQQPGFDQTQQAGLEGQYPPQPFAQGGQVTPNQQPQQPGYPNQPAPGTFLSRGREAGQSMPYPQPPQPGQAPRPDAQPQMPYGQPNQPPTSYPNQPRPAQQPPRHPQQPMHKPQQPQPRPEQYPQQPAWQGNNQPPRPQQPGLQPGQQPQQQFNQPRNDSPRPGQAPGQAYPQGQYPNQQSFRGQQPPQAPGYPSQYPQVPNQPQPPQFGPGQRPSQQPGGQPAYGPNQGGYQPNYQPGLQPDAGMSQPYPGDFGPQPQGQFGDFGPSGVSRSLGVPENAERWHGQPPTPHDQEVDGDVVGKSGKDTPDYGPVRSAASRLAKPEPAPREERRRAVEDVPEPEEDADNAYFESGLLEKHRLDRQPGQEPQPRTGPSAADRLQNNLSTDPEAARRAVADAIAEQEGKQEQPVQRGADALAQTHGGPDTDTPYHEDATAGIRGGVIDAVGESLTPEDHAQSGQQGYDYLQDNNRRPRR